MKVKKRKKGTKEIYNKVQKALEEYEYYLIQERDGKFSIISKKEKEQKIELLNFPVGQLSAEYRPLYYKINEIIRKISGIQCYEKDGGYQFELEVILNNGIVGIFEPWFSKEMFEYKNKGAITNILCSILDNNIRTYRGEINV